MSRLNAKFSQILITKYFEDNNFISSDIENFTHFIEVELQNIIEEAAKKVEIPLGQRNMSTAKKKDQFFNEITMTLSFESTPNQLTMFLSEIRNVPKFITIRNAQMAPVQMLQEAPKKGDFQKTVRVNLTVAALLTSPAQEKKG